MDLCDKSLTSKVEEVTKVLHECDFSLVKDDGCLQESVSQHPFSPWCPSRDGVGGTRGARSDFGRRENPERPRAQQAIARKLCRLYPPSAPEPFNWRPMVEKRTYKYVADNGCYRRTKKGATEPGAPSAGVDGGESSSNRVEARVRKYLRRLGRSRDGSSLPALHDRPVQTAASAATGASGAKSAAAASGAAGLWSPMRSFPHDGAAMADRRQEDGAPTGMCGQDSSDDDDVSPGPEDEAGAQHLGDRDRGDSSQPPLQLPELSGGGESGGRFGGAAGGRNSGLGSFDGFGTLGIDQKLDILNAELERDLAIYGGDTSWVSLLDHTPSSGCRPLRSLTTGSPALDWIVRQHPSKGFTSTTKVAGAAVGQPSSRNLGRFAKLRYITREGDVVFVPVYGCPVSLRSGTQQLGSCKKAYAACVTVSAPDGITSAIIEDGPGVAGVKYRLTKRAAASTSPASYAPPRNTRGEPALTKGMYRHH